MGNNLLIVPFNSFNAEITQRSNFPQFLYRNSEVHLLRFQLIHNAAQFEINFYSHFSETHSADNCEKKAHQERVIMTHSVALETITASILGK